MSAQRLSRKRRSLRSSSSLAPSAAVRTMKPPLASPFSLRRISFRRRRSASDSILRETPVWLTVGMKTRKRPGRAMCEVMRAPFLAMGSLAIWTRISWPGLSRSLMAGRLVVCMDWRPWPLEWPLRLRLRSRSRSLPRSLPRSAVAVAVVAATTSVASSSTAVGVTAGSASLVAP